MSSRTKCSHGHAPLAKMVSLPATIRGSVATLLAILLSGAPKMRHFVSVTMTRSTFKVWESAPSWDPNLALPQEPLANELVQPHWQELLNSRASSQERKTIAE